MDDDTYYESGDDHDQNRSDEEYASDDMLLKEVGDRPTSKIDYTILKEEDISELEKNYITQVSTVLSISKSDACLLLLHSGWRVTDVQEAWFSDEDKIREKVGLLKNPIVAGGNQIVNCGICSQGLEYNDDNSGGSILSASCGHRYCVDCWAGYISTSICKGGPSCLMLRCPESLCVAAVGPDLVQKVLLIANKEAEHDEYKCRLLRSFVENHSEIKWCPAPNCNYAVEFHIPDRISSYDVLCLCSHSYCWNCAEENHRPVDCETVKKWIVKNKEDDSKNAQWIAANTKACPVCGIPIEKNLFSKRMSCICGHKFCGDCLIPIKITGLYFSCEYCKSFKQGQQGQQTWGETKKVDGRSKARREIEKYTDCYKRWVDNGKSKEKAVEDFDKAKNVLIKEFGCIQENTSEHDYDFILQAWRMIIECWQFLRWTCVYEFYKSEDGEDRMPPLFEFWQDQAAKSLEWLHRYADTQLQQFLCNSQPLLHYSGKGYDDEIMDEFTEFRSQLEVLTKRTGDRFNHLAAALEDDLVFL